MDSLVRWADRHQDLDAALTGLRRIVPEGDPDRDRWALSALDLSLRLHMDQEEAILFPAYGPLSEGAPPNGSLRVLERDHALIRRLLDRLSALGTPVEAAMILAVQDALIQLGGVLDHHDLRERRYLKAILDATVPPEVRRGWIARFREDEDALPIGEALVPREAPPPRAHQGATPLQTMRLAVAQDGDVVAAWAEVPVPDHPKGPRIHARCARGVAALSPTNLLQRRDQLVDLSERLRLLAWLRPVSPPGRRDVQAPGPPTG